MLGQAASQSLQIDMRQENTRWVAFISLPFATRVPAVYRPKSILVRRTAAKKNGCLVSILQRHGNGKVLDDGFVGSRHGGGESCSLHQ